MPDEQSVAKTGGLLRSGIRAYQRVRDLAGRAIWGDAHTRRVFSRFYRRNVWSNAESRSGRSSTLAATDAVRKELPGLLADLGARSMLDAPCGDFNWMRHLELPLNRYVGADIVGELIESNRTRFAREGREFRVIDITNDSLPRVDVILCRDCLIHLSFDAIHAAIANFRRSGSTYLLTTTNTTSPGNRDVVVGDCFLLNLEKPPFDFPAPMRTLVESEVHGRSLGLWRIADL